MNLPQNVTIRYIHDLLHHGSNHDFSVDLITRHASLADGVVVGHFYKVTLTAFATGLGQICVGATIAEACRRALSDFGVTFRA